ncbi:MAG: serine/threonine-protein kinase [Myxococcota bacterium]
MSKPGPTPEMHASDPPDVRLGTTIGGNLTLRAVLGRGAMGVVYRAHQQSMDREVAVKVLSASAARDAASVRRFLQEARIASRLAHPHVVTVFDFGQSDDGQLYLMMELLDGHPLAEELAPGKRLTPERVVRILAQVCDATQHAHDHGLIHRDLKPENIFILESGSLRGDFVKVLDFGIARTLDGGSDGRITETGQVCGTPAYMSPEQALGGQLDARSDVYALGVIAYELLNGERPFMDRGFAALMRAHVREPVPPMHGVPPAIEAVVRQALAKDPAQRTASARAFADALAQALPTAGVAAHVERVPLARKLESSGSRDAATQLALVPDGSFLVEARVNQRRRRRVLGVAAALTLGALITAALMGVPSAPEAGGALPVEVDRLAKDLRAAAPEPTPTPAPAAAALVATPLGPSPSPSTTPSPSPSSTSINITTHPSGATVKVGGVAIGTTPLDLPRPAGSARVTVVIQRAGFATERRTLDAGGHDVVLNLHRLASPPPSSGGGSTGVIE